MSYKHPHEKFRERKRIANKPKESARREIEKIRIEINKTKHKQTIRSFLKSFKIHGEYNQEKKEKAQISNVRNKQQANTINSSGIKKLRRKYE